MKSKMMLALTLLTIGTTASAASYYCETDGIVNGKKSYSECHTLIPGSSLIANVNCLQWVRGLKLNSNRSLSQLVIASVFESNSNEPNPISAEGKCERDRNYFVQNYDDDNEFIRSEERIGRFDTTIFTRK